MQRIGKQCVLLIMNSLHESFAIILHDIREGTILLDFQDLPIPVRCNPLSRHWHMRFAQFPISNQFHIL